MRRDEHLRDSDLRDRGLHSVSARWTRDGGDFSPDRYIEGLQTIRPAPERVAPEAGEAEDKTKKRKNFGGKGGPSGNKNKGIKNAKRQAISRDR